MIIIINKVSFNTNDVLLSVNISISFSLVSWIKLSAKHLIVDAS